MKIGNFFQWLCIIVCLFFIVSSEIVDYPSWLMSAFYMLMFVVLTIKLILVIRKQRNTRKNTRGNTRGRFSCADEKQEK